MDTKQLSEQQYLTVEQIASLLQINPESVRRYVRSGKLLAVKLGGKYIRIEKSDLEEFIRKQKTGIL